MQRRVELTQGATEPVTTRGSHWPYPRPLGSGSLWGLEGVKGALSSADDTIRNYS